MTHVALLRGINVGGHTVKMETIRTVFESIGFRSVSTVIASGNVLFEAETEDLPELERQIEAGLLDALGYVVPTFIRTGPELSAILSSHPFGDGDTTDGGPVYVSFLHEPLSDDGTDRVLALNSDSDSFHVNGREVYWKCAVRMSDSPVFKRGLLEKALRAVSTSRNMKTVNTLAARSLS